jgi:AcrR family transcriptional regulator
MPSPVARNSGAIRRRPPDRRQQIVAAAAELFWRRGYPHVGVADVAARVEVGHSALYRHFRGKSDLLVAVLEEALRRQEAALDSAADGPGLLRALAQVGTHSREYLAAWQRDVAQLPPEQLGDLPIRRARLTARCATLAADLHPGEPAPNAALRARAALAVVESPSRHHTPLDPARDLEQLTRAALAVLHTPWPEQPQPEQRHNDPTPAGRSEPASRKAVLLPRARGEALLAVASRLFAERGYDAVSLTDIGAELGIAGPSIYNHFTNKLELLTAILQRGNETLWFALQRALAESARPQDAIAHMLDSYIEVLGAPPQVVSVLLTEVENLPTELRQHFRGIQHSYLEEWVALLCASRPDLNQHTALLLVLATFAVVDTLHRNPQSALPPPPAEIIRTLAHAPLDRPQV